ncbi:MAG TPA: Clp protease N-terminal domain-containing protein [Tepidisphaeraceae bacterium]|jgi:ATP-dependent Clp protease ATP-binding subunit ClpC
MGKMARSRLHEGTFARKGHVFERFSYVSRKAVAVSNQQVHRLGGNVIGDVDLLLGIIVEGTGVGAAVLRDLGVELSALRNQLEREPRNPSNERTPELLPQSQEFKLAIEDAIEISRTMDHDVVGTHHMLLGLLAHAEFASSRILASNGVSFELVRASVLEAISSGQVEVM